MTEHLPLNTSPLPVKLRVEDYLLLDRSGAFDRYGKTELIDGMVVALSPQFRPHGYTKDELTYRLRRALETMESSFRVATEQSVDMSPTSMPQPDIILTSEPRGDGAIPLASVALLIEVSSTTLAYDQGEKAGIYSANRVQEYWVVDLEGRVIHQMWSPGAGGYAERRTVALGERVEAVTVDGLAVETGGI